MKPLTCTVAFRHDEFILTSLAQQRQCQQLLWCLMHVMTD